jgi:hypothetical protein
MSLLKFFGKIGTADNNTKKLFVSLFFRRCFFGSGESGLQAKILIAGLKKQSFPVTSRDHLFFI